jgi:HAD superfamily hydrolase (TIGR01484 family)
MIKAIITDVDGVIVGHTKNVNFPIPHIAILNALHAIREKNIPIILCTAKSMHAIKPIIEKSYLNNPHISDGGALIYDPVDRVTVAKHLLDVGVARKIIDFSAAHAIYAEVHKEAEYFIAKQDVGYFSEAHGEIMMQGQTVVPNMAPIVDLGNIIKLVVVCKDQEQKKTMHTFLNELENEVTSVWTQAPSMLPAEFVIVTAPGVSKGNAVKEVLANLGIFSNETLGIGDTPGDWKFMEHCGYAGVMGRDFPEFIAQVKTKGEGKYTVAPSVEENGFLEIIKFFNL